MLENLKFLLNFLGRYLIATVLIISIIVGIITVSDKIPVLNKLQFSIFDYQLTDNYYSNFWKSEPKRDDIVLVNIKRVRRDTIGYLINKINQHEPSAIGLSVFFPKEKDPHTDSILRESIKKSKNLVLMGRLSDVENDVWNAFETSDSSFFDFDHPPIVAQVSLAIDQKEVVRSVFPRELLGNDTVNFLSYELARIYEPSSVSEIELQSELWIKYKADTSGFQILDPIDVFELGEGTLKDKIVILGFLGLEQDEIANTFFYGANIEDKFYTPLNNVIVGNKQPDTYGVVILANIVAMMLDNDLITDLNNDFLVNRINELLLFMYIILLDMLLGKYHKIWILRIVCYTVIVVAYAISNLLFFQFNYLLDLRPFVVISIFLPDILPLYFKKILPAFLALSTQIKRTVLGLNS